MPGCSRSGRRSEAARGAGLAASRGRGALRAPPSREREAKRAIARAAIELVADGDSLIIDTGTTTSIFAQELRNRRGLTIVTNSSDIARTLATVNGNRVYMAGGELKADNGASFGTTAVEFISRFRVRHAFISIAALHPVDGPMDMAFEEAELARMAMSRADNRVILTDSTKFGKTALVKVCDFSDVNRLYTDDRPGDDLAAVLEKRRGGAPCCPSARTGLEVKSHIIPVSEPCVAGG